MFVSLLLLLGLTSISAKLTAKEAKKCGYVDTKDSSIRLGSCYVQCSEISNQCTAERFFCDENGKLFFEQYSDNECSEKEKEAEPIEIKLNQSPNQRVKDYSCGTEDDEDACVTFTFIDKVKNNDNEECGMLLSSAELVANRCFEDGEGGSFMQTCNDIYTKIVCDDTQCQVNCRDENVDLQDVSHNGCITVQCQNELTGEFVGTPLYFHGTPRNPFDWYLGRWNPLKWPVMVWMAVIIACLLAVNAYYVYKNYKIDGKLTISEVAPLLKKV